VNEARTALLWEQAFTPEVDDKWANDFTLPGVFSLQKAKGFCQRISYIFTRDD